jgi:hypothetical protein
VNDFVRRNHFLKARNRIETICAGATSATPVHQDQQRIKRRDGRKSDHPEDDRADERKRGKGHQNVESVDEVHGKAPEFDVTCAISKPSRSASLKKAGTLIYPHREVGAARQRAIADLVARWRTWLSLSEINTLKSL